MELTVLEILNKPHLLKYRFKLETERKAIRLKFTLALIEDILNENRNTR